MKFDLNKFKKVNSDRHTTTLRHPDGHDIKIAHKALSPKMRKELMDMPGHEQDGVQHFADGGMSEPQASIMPSEEQMIMQEANQVNQPQPEAAPQVASAEVMPEQPQQQMAAAPAPKEDLMGYDAYQKNTMEGVNEQKQGINLGAKAQAQQAQLEDKFLKDSADAQKALMETHQQHTNDLEQENAHFMDDLNKKHIDPNHFWADKSTGQKLATGVGLILGGFAAGTNGGHNPVMENLNKQIDRDIESQKMNMGKTENLLSLNMKRMGNMNDAMSLTKAMQLDILSNNLKQAAAKATSQQARANALMEAGKLDVQSAGLRQSIAKNKTISEFMQHANNDPSKIPAVLSAIDSVDPHRGAELREMYVPGVGMADKKVPHEIVNKIIAGKDLQDKIADLRAFSKGKSGFWNQWNPQDKQLAEQKTKMLMDAYRQAKAQGVFKASEAEFDAAIIPQNPLSFYQSVVNGNNSRYEALQQNALHEQNNLLRGYGLKPQKSRDLDIRPMGK